MSCFFGLKHPNNHHAKLLQKCFILPETNIFAPENGWLEGEFPFGFRPIFTDELLVSGRVDI